MSWQSIAFGYIKKAMHLKRSFKSIKNFVFDALPPTEVLQRRFCFAFAEIINFVGFFFFLQKKNRSKT